MKATAKHVLDGGKDAEQRPGTMCIFALHGHMCISVQAPHRQCYGHAAMSDVSLLMHALICRANQCTLVLMHVGVPDS